MKNNNHYLIIALLLLTAWISLGLRNHKTAIDIRDNDSLRIEFVGTKSHRIIVDKKKCSKGSVILAKQNLKLSKGEYIKVTNKRTGATFYLSHKGFKVTSSSSVSAYIRKRYAAGKGKSDFGAILKSYPWQMVNDTLRIPTIMQLDNNHGFILRTFTDNMEIRIPYDTETNELVLTNDYFHHNNIEPKENIDYTFLVEYWDHNNCEVITDQFIIQYVPVIK